MNNELLKNSLEVLTLLRSEVHDNLDSSALEKLDDLILKLKEAEKDKDTQIDPKIILEQFGMVLGFLEGINKLVELVKDFLDV